MALIAAAAEQQFGWHQLFDRGIVLIVGAAILATQVGPLKDKEIRWKRHSL
jgi:hypothetical protein